MECRVCVRSVDGSMLQKRSTTFNISVMSASRFSMMLHCRSYNSSKPASMSSFGRLIDDRRMWSDLWKSQQLCLEILINLAVLVPLNHLFKREEKKEIRVIIKASRCQYDDFYLNFSHEIHSSMVRSGRSRSRIGSSCCWQRRTSAGRCVVWIPRKKRDGYRIRIRNRSNYFQDKYSRWRTGYSLVSNEPILIQSNINVAILILRVFLPCVIHLLS